MASSRSSDARALVFAIASLVVAGIVVAVTILLLTRSGGESLDESGPFSIGEADALETDLEDGGPFYIPDPFGGDGLWVALERERIVALVLDARGRDDCAIRWVGRRDRFEDCDGSPLETTEQDRYQLTIPEAGDREGQVLVDLEVVEPAPSP